MHKDNQYDRIVAFLNEIGIPVREATIEEDTFLPGIFLEKGGLIVDRQKLLYPGDMLHEAGHIAVMKPSERVIAVKDVGNDQGEEIAAHAWSYAAAKACDVPPEAVFHENGYQGNGETMAHWYNDGHWPGVPLLAWMGLTGHPQYRPDEEPELPKFPDMKAWIRAVEDPASLCEDT